MLLSDLHALDHARLRDLRLAIVDRGDTVSTQILVGVLLRRLTGSDSRAPYVLAELRVLAGKLPEEGWSSAALQVIVGSGAHNRTETADDARSLAKARG